MAWVTHEPSTVDDLVQTAVETSAITTVYRTSLVQSQPSD